MSSYFQQIRKGVFDFAVVLERQSENALTHALHIIAVWASKPGYRPLPYDPVRGRFGQKSRELC